MMHDGKAVQIDMQFRDQWMGQPAPPAGLIEERVLELEQLGLIDEEDLPGVPSSIRQFAAASLLHKKPPYFVTVDEQLLGYRDILEPRYGMMIFSIPEAIMLFQESDGPPN